MINKEEIFLEFQNRILPVLLRKLKEEHIFMSFIIRYEQESLIYSNKEKLFAKHIEVEYRKIMSIINYNNEQSVILTNYDGITIFSYNDFTNHKDNFFILIVIRFLKRTHKSQNEVTKWCNEVFQQLNLKKHD